MTTVPPLFRGHFARERRQAYTISAGSSLSLTGPFTDGRSWLMTDNAHGASRFCGTAQGHTKAATYCCQLIPSIWPHCERDWSLVSKIGDPFLMRRWESAAYFRIEVAATSSGSTDKEKSGPRLGPSDGSATPLSRCRRAYCLRRGYLKAGPFHVKHRPYQIPPMRRSGSGLVKPQAVAYNLLGEQKRVRHRERLKSNGKEEHGPSAIIHNDHAVRGSTQSPPHLRRFLLRGA